MQRREMSLIELVLLVALPSGYATLMLALSAWIARALAVRTLVIALPLAVAPVLVALGKHWRNSWFLVAPAVACIILALPEAARSDWKGAFYAACGAATTWVLALSLVGAARRSIRHEG